MSRIRRAIVSVCDKRGLVVFARNLTRHGIEILCTGGTARHLSEAGVVTTPIASYTGAPEILDGRVKTLHPRVHGGLLARDTPAHAEELRLHSILPIDLAVVNLLPFQKTVARPGVSLEEAMADLDIGGPAIIRSAALNYERVAVVTDPDDYELVAAELDHGDGEVSRATRFRLARRAFAHTAAYDGAIAAYLSSLPAEGAPAETFPEFLTLSLRRGRVLRYGENPHQHAALYVDERGLPALARAAVHQGRPLSYNNILDLDAGLGCSAEFAAPAAVIVKHTDPCGVGVEETVAGAYRRAAETDPGAVRGGTVALNRAVDAALARTLAAAALDCIIAPSFEDAALAALAVDPGLRVLSLSDARRADDRPEFVVRSVSGGLLVQTQDVTHESAASAHVLSRRAPTAAENRALDFAWRVSKHVDSNAIVVARDGQTVGIGAGQMDRLDSLHLALSKAKLPVSGAVAASDGYFPGPACIEALAAAGVTAAVEPGDSPALPAVVAAADAHGIALVATGVRHFRH